MSSLRIGHFTSAVHKATETSHSAVKKARCQAARLLTRLADSCRYSKTGPAACPDDHQFAPVSRLDHHLREVQPNTQPGRLKVQYVHQHWMTNPVITTRDIHRLLGMVVFMATLVPRGRLRLRPFQWWAATAWRQRTGNWSDRITVPQWVPSEVAWWSSLAVRQGLPLAARETEVTLFTDASSSSWGAQLGSHSQKGLWSASQRSWHINVLEMQIMINAVRTFLPHVRSRVVRLMCDNAVTVVYIKNEGGTQSFTLMQLKIRLLKWCDRKAIKLVPVHLPGVHNIQADSLSRVGQTTE